MTTSQIPGPQGNAKATAKPRYRHYFGPRASREERLDNGVLDAGRRGGTSQALVAEGGSQAHGNLADSLGVGVGNGLVGPRVAELARGESTGPGHDLTLGLVAPVAGQLDSSRTSRDGVDSNQHSEGLDPLVAQYVLNYTPVSIPAEDWAVIGDFVREAVLDAKPDRKHTAKVWLYSLAYFVHWCWSVCRLPLDRQVIFQPPHISRYVAEQMEAKGNSRATVRSKLRYIAAALGIQPEGEDYEYSSFGRLKGSVPYTATELADIRIYVQATGTARKKHTLTALMAFGCGAGLRPNELLLITKDDLEFDDAGIAVNVGGQFPRRVPLLRSFEDFAYRTWEASDGGHLVLPNVTKRGPMVVANFLYTCPNSPLRPHMQRLRSTWIVEHLNARVPFPVLRRAAGVDSLSAFDRYLDYVDLSEPIEADGLLRSGASHV